MENVLLVERRLDRRYKTMVKGKESKARKVARKAGVDVKMIEKFRPNFYKTKKKKRK